MWRAGPFLVPPRLSGELPPAKRQGLGQPILRSIPEFCLAGSSCPPAESLTSLAVASPATQSTIAGRFPHSKRCTAAIRLESLGLPGSFTGDWPRRVCHGQAGMLDSRPRDMTEAARFTNRSRPFSVTKSRRSGHDEFIGNHHRLAGRHAGGRWERGSGGHSPVHHHAALHHAATLHHAA